MNFKDLLEKMQELDQIQPQDQDHYPVTPDTEAEDVVGEAGQGVMAPPSEPELPECGDTPSVTGQETPLMGEEGKAEECGMMPPMGSMAPKQPDNVTMNVSMNGSGSGGIKDLLDILRNIENEPSAKDADSILVGMEEFANQPDEKVAGIDAVTPTGDDLFSKGAEAEKVNGGGNPMQPGVSESLIAQLNSLYQEVKLR